MEVWRALCLAALALASALATASATPEPQVLVLSSDKLPAIQPAGDAAPAESKSSAVQTASLQPNLQAIQSLQALQRLQALQNLQGAVERAKRSGNILQLLGGASGSSSGTPGAGAGAAGGLGGGGGLLGGGGILGSLLGSSSSNSATGGIPVDGKGPTYGNYIGTGAGLPMVHGSQRTFDLQSFKRSLLGVLMQAVRAITGGVIALKGQLVRVKAPPPRPVYGPPSYMGALPIPRPVYGPPMMYGHAHGAGLGAPLTYGQMAALGQLPIPRHMYGLPGLPGMSGLPGQALAQPPPSVPVFNIFSNAVGSDSTRFRPPPPAPVGPLPAHVPPPLPIPATKPQPLPSLPAQYSSHSISGALNSYGPPAAGTPFSSSPAQSPGTSYSTFGNGQAQSQGTSFPSGPAQSPGSSYSTFSNDQAQSQGHGTSSFSSSPSLSGGSQYSSGPGPSYADETSLTLDSGSSQDHGAAPDFYGPPSHEAQPQPPTGSGGPGSQSQDINSLVFSEPAASYGSPEPGAQSSDSYYKRNTNQGRETGQAAQNPLQGAHAGLLLLKPVRNVSPQPGNTNLVQEAVPANQNENQAKNPQSTYFEIPHSISSDSAYAPPNFGSRIGESADGTNSGKNDRTFSLLFGAKKPAPLRPHPVTRALPPQVVAAASAQLAAQLDLAGRAPPRTAVAVSGPQGKFIMYHK